MSACASTSSTWRRTRTSARRARSSARPARRATWSWPSGASTASRSSTRRLTSCSASPSTRCPGRWARRRTTWSRYRRARSHYSRRRSDRSTAIRPARAPTPAMACTISPLPLAPSRPAPCLRRTPRVPRVPEAVSAPLPTLASPSRALATAQTAGPRL